MYWFRALSLPDLALYALLTMLWATGGWLLARRLLPLRSTERLICGLAAGWMLFISTSNLLAHLFPITAAFWAASGLIGLAGVFVSIRRGTFSLPGWKEDLRAWPMLAALLALSTAFLLMERSISLFDDYLHLPLVSIMAAGDIPPHYYLDPSQHFGYHYGLHVWAASLVRLAGFFPWSAFDLAKAFAIALTTCLAWCWVCRWTGSRLAAYLGSTLIVFGGGARWLLLLLPAPWQDALGVNISLINAGAASVGRLSDALASPWIVEGSGKYLFPFAFHNGIYVPVFFILGASGALPFAAILLMMLSGDPKRLTWGKVILISLIFSNLALSGEHIFAILWGCLFLILLAQWLLRGRQGGNNSTGQLVAWAAILGLSGSISAIQGGFITEELRGLYDQWLGLVTTNSAVPFTFSLRWPPAVQTAHFGVLSLADPAQILVILTELGPVLALAPAAAWLAWRGFNRKAWLAAALGVAGLLSFLFPVFWQYGLDRTITRIMGTGLWIWSALGFVVVWRSVQKATIAAKVAWGAGYIAALVGGAVLLTVQIMNVPYPQISYFVSGMDAQMSAHYWNQLGKSAQILDNTAYRSVALFGNASKSNITTYISQPGWETLVADPDPQHVAQAGYDYVYLDKRWSQKLDIYQTNRFKQACVRLVAELTEPGGDFRRLYDVSACRSTP